MIECVCVAGGIGLGFGIAGIEVLGLLFELSFGAIYNSPFNFIYWIQLHNSTKGNNYLSNIRSKFRALNRVSFYIRKKVKLMAVLTLASNNTSHQVTVTDTFSSNPSGDYIRWHYKPSSSGTYIQVNPDTACTSSLAYNFTYSLLASTQYDFRADVYLGDPLAGGTFLQHDDLNGITTVPPALSGLSATGHNTYVHLAWTASSGATGYNITWSPGSGSASVGAVTTSDILGLTNGTSYTFTVTPTNAGGSGSSQSASATPNNTRPSNFAWTYAGYDSGGVLQSGTSKVSGYGIYVGSSEWSSLCSSVNSFRLYKSLSSFTFTTTTAGVTGISAAIYNEVRTKINDMSPPTALPAAVTAGVTDIVASHFNGLRDSLNSIT